MLKFIICLLVGFSIVMVIAFSIILNAYNKYKKESEAALRYLKTRLSELEFNNLEHRKQPNYKTLSDEMLEASKSRLSARLEKSRVEL